MTEGYKGARSPFFHINNVPTVFYGWGSGDGWARVKVCEIAQDEGLGQTSERGK